jgi:hypothetical protein
MCMLKLLHNVVTVGTEALVTGNKFLYAFVKKVCRLWAQPRFDTFRQLLIIVEALWSQTILQVDSSRSERDHRCKECGQTTPSWSAPSVLECEQLYADGHCHGGELYLVSAIQAYFSEWSYAVSLVFRNKLVTLLWSIVA